MTNERVTRKIDNVGRVSIPKSLRVKYDCVEGTEVEFYTFTDGDGKTYICIAKAE
jgi:bifunctional DNA-binding transcriptional regulator/antitoxin component of YhaV-PrlF toxin-antitoxin module